MHACFTSGVLKIPLSSRWLLNICIILHINTLSFLCVRARMCDREIESKTKCFLCVCMFLNTYKEDTSAVLSLQCNVYSCILEKTTEG